MGARNAACEDMSCVIRDKIYGSRVLTLRETVGCCHLTYGSGYKKGKCVLSYNGTCGGWRGGTGPLVSSQEKVHTYVAQLL